MVFKSQGLLDEAATSYNEKKDVKVSPWKWERNPKRDEARQKHPNLTKKNKSPMTRLQANASINYCI